MCVFLHVCTYTYIHVFMYTQIYVYIYICICVYIYTCIAYTHYISLSHTHSIYVISKYVCPYPNIHTCMHMYKKESYPPPLRNNVEHVHQKRYSLYKSIYACIYFCIFIYVLYIFLYLYLCLYLNLFINIHIYICRYIHVKTEKQKGDRRAHAHRWIWMCVYRISCMHVYKKKRVLTKTHRAQLLTGYIFEPPPFFFPNASPELQPAHFNLTRNHKPAQKNRQCTNQTN